ncbi:MAG TPA: SRPBCC family protein [Stenomitos sp.]
MRAQLQRTSLSLVAGLTLTASWLVGGPASAEATFASLTDEDQARIEKGEIVVRVERTNTPLKSFMCVGQVEAPASKVFKAYTDFEHYPEIFNLRDAKVTRKDEATYHVRATLIVPWPIGERWVTNETRLLPDAYSFVYRRAEGSIVEYTGSLKVVPKGPNLSQVYYVAKVDPGIPFMPTWLLNRFQESMLPNSIQNVRDYLKRHQEY